MRTTTLTLLLLCLATRPALALPGGNSATLRIQNKCDEAVQVSVPPDLLSPFFPGSSEFILEPNSSTDVGLLTGGKNADVEVMAVLVSDPSVSATKSVRVHTDKTTTAEITCSTSKGQTRLSIGNAKGNSKKVAAIRSARDAQVMLASSGGLGFLLLLGALFGHAPHRRRSLPLKMSIDGNRSMRTMSGTILLTLTAAGPVMALEGGDNTSLFIRNGCDEAVQVNVAPDFVNPTWGVSQFILEPDSSRTVPLATDGKNVNVPVTAALVADSSVRTTASIRVRSNKTTSIEITCTLVSGQTTLKIGSPKGKAKHAVTAADTAREADVLLASSGGLGLLLLLGTFLGRAPRRRNALTDGDEPLTSDGRLPRALRS